MPSIAASSAIRAQPERSPRQTAIVSFGKKATTSLLTTVAGIGFNEIMGTAGGVMDKATNQVSKATGLYAIEGAKGVLARSTMRLVNQVSNNAIGGLIGSVEFKRDYNGNITGLGMDGDAVRERLIGRDALAGYVSSFAGSLAEGALGEYNLKDANRTWLNSQTISVDSIKGLNSLAGSAVSGAIEFGMTGSTTINVLNLRDLTGGKLSGGLLALTLGKDGISGTISSAGTDVSFGRLAVAAAGLAESRAVTRLKYGDAEERMQLTIANGLGYTTNKDNWALGRDIFTGAKKIAYDDKLRMDGEVKEYGYYDREGGDPDTIYLNSSLLADGVHAGAIASSVVAHEGVHMRGERREALAYHASGSAFDELSTAWGVSDYSFQAINAMGFMDERNWIANTGGRDYLGVRRDGSIYDDKDYEHINYEDGRPREDIPYQDGDRRGFQKGLERWLEMNPGEGFSKLIAATENDYDNVKKMWIKELDVGRGIIDSAFREKKITEEQYYKIVGRPLVAEMVGRETAKETLLQRLGLEPVLSDYATSQMIQAEAAMEMGGAIRKGFSSLINWFKGWGKDNGKTVDTKDISSSSIYNSVEKRFKEIEGLPYAHDYKKQQKLDASGKITIDSTGMNCIGLVSYLFDFRADYSVANFDKYVMFEKLHGIKSFSELQIGDVIRFRAGLDDNHVSIWAGDGKVIESVSSSRKPGVRIDDIRRMTNYYSKTYGNKYNVDYFRYRQKEEQE